MELTELTIIVRVNGVTEVALPTVRLRPAGLLVKVKTTVCGSSCTLVVPLAPEEFVARSCSSIHDG